MQEQKFMKIICQSCNSQQKMKQWSHLFLPSRGHVGQQRQDPFPMRSIGAHNGVEGDPAEAKNFNTPCCPKGALLMSRGVSRVSQHRFQRHSFRSLKGFTKLSATTSYNIHTASLMAYIFWCLQLRSKNRINQGAHRVESRRFACGLVSLQLIPLLHACRHVEPGAARDTRIVCLGITEPSSIACRC